MVYMQTALLQKKISLTKECGLLYQWLNISVVNKHIAPYMQTALCVIYLALEERLEKEELKEIFFSADLTLAEVESGINSFDEIEKDLLERVGDVGMIEE